MAKKKAVKAPKALAKEALERTVIQRLNLDTGREDFNQIVSKINELVDHANG